MLFNSFTTNLRKEKYYDEKAMVPLTSRGDTLSEKYSPEKFLGIKLTKHFVGSHFSCPFYRI